MLQTHKLKTLGSEVVTSSNLTLVIVLLHFHFVLLVHLISSIELVFVVYVTDFGTGWVWPMD